MDIKEPGYRDTGSNQLSRCRHTVAVQRAICALNRNALWNNAQDLARDKGYYCCCQSVFSFVVSVVARCRGLVPTFFLCLVDPLYSDRIWKCLLNELLLPVMGCSLFRTQRKIVVKGNCWGERYRQRHDVAIFFRCGSVSASTERYNSDVGTLQSGTLQFR